MVNESYTVDLRSRRTLSHGHDLEPPRPLRFLWGLKARADPSGVDAFHSDQLHSFFINIITSD